MTRTLADMTPAEQQACIGMWATFHGSNSPRPVIIWDVVDDTVWLLSHTSRNEIMRTDLELITPRYDLLPAWTPAGEPIPGEWEYAVGHVVEDEDGQRDCRPRHREDSRQSALASAEELKDDGYVAMCHFIIDWEEA